MFYFKCRFRPAFCLLTALLLLFPTGHPTFVFVCFFFFSFFFIRPVRPRWEEYRLCWGDSTHSTWGRDHVLLWSQLFWWRQWNVWMLHLWEVRPLSDQTWSLSKSFFLNRFYSSKRWKLWTFNLFFNLFFRNGEGHFKHRGKQPEIEETKDPVGQKYRLRERYLRHHRERGHFSTRPITPGIHSGIFKGNQFGIFLLKSFWAFPKAQSEGLHIKGKFIDFYWVR